MSLNQVNTRSSHSRRASANNMNNPDNNINQVNNIKVHGANNSSAPIQVDQVTALTRLIESLQLEVATLKNQVIASNSLHNTFVTNMEQKDKLNVGLSNDSSFHKD